MKGKSKYKLSPNEEARVLKEEKERRRKLRLQQVRQQSKCRAAKICKDVKDERNRQKAKVAVSVLCEWEEEHNEKIGKMEAAYEKNLNCVGEGHQEAKGVEAELRDEYKLILQQEEARIADMRGREAMAKLHSDMEQQVSEERKHIMQRQMALILEKARAAEVAKRPAPKPDPLKDILDNAQDPPSVPVTDMTAFSSTHYHVPVGVSVERAAVEEDEETARAAAVWAGERYDAAVQEKLRQETERTEKARLRHKHALHKEMLKQDYEKMMVELSELQRADQVRRQKVVASIPKQIFLPPHRRLEEKADAQTDMERAFEDMYLAATDLQGDLSLALDPNPPPSHTTDAGLDLSVLDEPAVAPPGAADGTTGGDGGGGGGKKLTVLGDVTNIVRNQIIRTDKTPDEGLKKVLSRIRRQRDDWVSKISSEDDDAKTECSGSEVRTDGSLTQYTNTESEAEARSRGQARSEDMSLEEGTIVSSSAAEENGTLLHPMEQTNQTRGGSKEAEVGSHGFLEAERRRQDVMRREEDRIQQDTARRQQQIQEQKRQLEERLAEIEARKRNLEQQMLDVSATKANDEHPTAEYDGPFKRPLPPAPSKTDREYDRDHRAAAGAGSKELRFAPMPGREAEHYGAIREPETNRPIREPDTNGLMREPGIIEPLGALGTTHQERMARFEAAPGIPASDPSHPSLDRSRHSDQDSIRAYQQRLLSRPQSGPEKLRAARLELERKAQELLRQANEDYLHPDLPTSRVSDLGRFQDVDLDRSPSDTDAERYYSRQSLGSSTRSRPSGETAQTQYLPLPADLKSLSEGFEQQSLHQGNYLPEQEQEDAHDRTLTEDDHREEQALRYPPPSYQDVSADRERHQAAERWIQPGEDVNARPLSTLVAENSAPGFASMLTQRGVDSLQRTPEQRSTYRSSSFSPDRQSRTKSPDRRDEPRRSPDRRDEPRRSPDRRDDPRRSPDRRDDPRRSPERQSPAMFSPVRVPKSPHGASQPLAPGVSEHDIVSLNDQLLAIRLEKEKILARQARQREEMEEMRKQWQHSLHADAYMLDVSQRVDELHDQTPGRNDTTTSDEPTPIDLLNPNIDPNLTPKQSPQRGPGTSPKYFSPKEARSSGEVLVYAPAEVRDSFLEREDDEAHDNSYEPHELSTIREDVTPQDDSSQLQASAREEIQQRQLPHASKQYGDLPPEEDAQFRSLRLSDSDGRRSARFSGAGSRTEEFTGGRQGHGNDQQDYARDPPDSRDAREFSQEREHFSREAAQDQGRQREDGYTTHRREEDGYSTSADPSKTQANIYASLEDLQSAFQPEHGGITISSAEERSPEQSGLSDGTSGNRSDGLSEGLASSNDTGEFRPSRDWSKELAKYSVEKSNSDQGGELGNSEDVVRDVLEALKRTASSKSHEDRLQGSSGYQEQSTLRSRDNGSKTQAWSPDSYSRKEPVPTGAGRISTGSQALSTGSIRSSTGSYFPSEETERSVHASAELVQVRESVGSFHPLALEDTMSEYRRRSQSPVAHRSSQPIDSSTPAKDSNTRKAALSREDSPAHKPFQASYVPPRLASETQTQFASHFQHPFDGYRARGTPSQDPFSPHRQSEDGRKSSVLSQHPIESSIEQADMSPRSDTNSQKSAELSQYPASDASNGRSGQGSSIVFHGRNDDSNDATLQSFKSSKLETESPLFHSTYDSDKIKAYFEAMPQKAGGSGGFDLRSSDMDHGLVRETALEDYNVALRTPDKRSAERRSPTVVRFASHHDVHQMSTSQSSGSEIQHRDAADGPDELSRRVQESLQRHEFLIRQSRDKWGAASTASSRESPTLSPHRPSPGASRAHQGLSPQSRASPHPRVSPGSSPLPQRESPGNSKGTSPSRITTKPPVSAQETTETWASPRKIPRDVSPSSHGLYPSQHGVGTSQRTFLDFRDELKYDDPPAVLPSTSAAVDGSREFLCSGGFPEQQREEQEKRWSAGSAASRQFSASLSQHLIEESGITEEPNLTLVSLSTTQTEQSPSPSRRPDLSRPSTAEPSPSRASGAEQSSLLSFEQHEQSVRSSGSHFSPLVSQLLSSHDRTALSTQSPLASTPWSPLQPEAHRSSGQRSEGQRSSREWPESQRSSGQRSESQRSSREWPESQRSSGQRSEGQRSSGQRSESQRSSREWMEQSIPEASTLTQHAFPSSPNAPYSGSTDPTLSQHRFSSSSTDQSLTQHRFSSSTDPSLSQREATAPATQHMVSRQLLQEYSCSQPPEKTPSHPPMSPFMPEDHRANPAAAWERRTEIQTIQRSIGRSQEVNSRREVSQRSLFVSQGTDQVAAGPAGSSKEVRFSALVPDPGESGGEGGVSSIPIVQVDEGGSHEDSFSGLSLAQAFAKKRTDFEASSKRRQEEGKRKAQQKSARQKSAQPSMSRTVSSWKQQRGLKPGKSSASASSSSTSQEARLYPSTSSSSTVSGVDRKKSEREMKDRTSRLYSRSEEARKKKEEEERKKQYKANREKAKDYHKKTQEKRKKKEGK